MEKCKMGRKTEIQISTSGNKKSIANQTITTKINTTSSKRRKAYYHHSFAMQISTKLIDSN